jgi:predicted MPP superfamily phosphohydrolase
MNDGFVRGLYGAPGGPFLYVSPGIGQSGCYPLRLFNPSEITVFTLKRLQTPITNQERK